MPTGGYFPQHPQDQNPRLWASIRKQVEADMVKAGWNPKAGKFDEVARRKTHQAWRRKHASQ